jgi:hypothetical protein
MMKGTLDIRRVLTPARQRVVAIRKRTLRRRSVRAARSVWSRLLSRVIEYRNFIVEVFLLDPGGTVLCRAAVTERSEARPVFVSGAKEYHLLIETPRGNLVESMKWLQGAFTQRMNAMQQTWGHLFQGRYKAKDY